MFGYAKRRTLRFFHYCPSDLFSESWNSPRSIGGESLFVGFCFLEEGFVVGIASDFYLPVLVLVRGRFGENRTPSYAHRRVTKYQETHGPSSKNIKSRSGGSRSSASPSSFVTFFLESRGQNQRIKRAALKQSELIGSSRLHMRSRIGLSSSDGSEATVYKIRLLIFRLAPWHSESNPGACNPRRSHKTQVAFPHTPF